MFCTPPRLSAGPSSTALHVGLLIIVSTAETEASDMGVYPPVGGRASEAVDNAPGEADAGSSRRHRQAELPPSTTRVVPVE